MTNPIAWFRALRAMVSNYTSDLARIQRRIADLEKVLRERTNVAVDFGGHRDAHNYVVVIGRYRNVDYVQTYSLGERDLAALIPQLREMERYATVRRIDAPPAVRAVFGRD